MSKTMTLWKRGLALVMKGNLYYKHVVERSGVTNDPEISEWTAFDVLAASTSNLEKKGYEKVSVEALLHTFLTLLEKRRFITEGTNFISVQYNREVMFRCKG